jgi:hypothetical protein
MEFLDLGQFGHGAYQVKTRSHNKSKLTIDTQKWLDRTMDAEFTLRHLLALIVVVGLLIAGILAKVTR